MRSGSGSGVEGLEGEKMQKTIKSSLSLSPIQRGPNCISSHKHFSDQILYGHLRIRTRCGSSRAGRDPDREEYECQREHFNHLAGWKPNLQTSTFWHTISLSFPPSLPSILWFHHLISHPPCHRDLLNPPHPPHAPPPAHPLSLPHSTPLYSSSSPPFTLSNVTFIFLFIFSDYSSQ